MTAAISLATLCLVFGLALHGDQSVAFVSLLPGGGAVQLSSLRCLLAWFSRISRAVVCVSCGTCCRGDEDPSEIQHGASRSDEHDSNFLTLTWPGGLCF